VDRLRTKAVVGADAEFFLIEPRIAPAFIFERLERRLLWSGDISFGGMDVIDEPAPPPAPPIVYGPLDENFGNGGSVRTDVTGDADRAYTVLAQPDGKIILAGYSGNVLGDGVYNEEFITLVRYNADGSLDQSFGNDGIVIAKCENITHYHYDTSDLPAALQPDGKILVGGAALYRFNPDGSPDTSFGDNGVAAKEQLLMMDSMALAPDGGIVISTRYGWVFQRYNPDGTLDQSWGDNGSVIVDYDGKPALETDGKVVFDTELGDITFQPDGKMLAVAAVRLESGARKSTYGVLRLNADGSVDQSFGNGGVVHTSDPEEQWVDVDARIAVQRDGKIVIAGGDGNIQMIRYNADGSLDQSFGDNGQVVGPANEAGGMADIAFQADGKIVLSSQDGAIRYNADGSLDRTFIAPNFPPGASVAIAPDGDILVAGLEPRLHTSPPSGPAPEHDQDFVLVRFEGDSEPATTPPPAAGGDDDGLQRQDDADPVDIPNEDMFAGWEARQTSPFFKDDSSILQDKDEELLPAE
jgi:uncharacterized delta-60 repeat protein